MVAWSTFTRPVALRMRSPALRDFAGKIPRAKVSRRFILILKNLEDLEDLVDLADLADLADFGFKI